MLVASACGSSSAKADPAADLQVAKGAVLTKADLPASFDASPYNSSNSLPDSAKLDFANCMNTKLSIFSDSPGEQKVNSDDFDDSNSQGQTEIQNEVDVYPKKSTVNDDYNVLTKDAATGCLQKLFTTAIQAAQTQSTDTTDPGSGPTFGTVTVAKLNVSGVGDHVIGFRDRPGQRARSVRDRVPRLARRDERPRRGHADRVERADALRPGDGDAALEQSRQPHRQAAQLS